VPERDFKHGSEPALEPTLPYCENQWDSGPKLGMVLWGLPKPTGGHALCTQAEFYPTICCSRARLSGMWCYSTCTATFSDKLIIVFSSSLNPGLTAAYGRSQQQDVDAWT